MTQIPKIYLYFFKFSQTQKIILKKLATKFPNRCHDSFSNIPRFKETVHQFYIRVVNKSIKRKDCGTETNM